MKKLIVLSFLCLSYIIGFTQDLSEDLSTMYQQVPEQIEISMEINMLDANKKVQQVQTVIIAGSKDYYFMRNMGMDYLFADNWYLMINHTDRIIMMREQESPDFDSEMVIDAFVDSITTKMSNVTYLGIIGGKKKYKADYKNGTYKSVELKLNKESKFPENLLYEYTSSDYYGFEFMEINYSKTHQISAQSLNVSHYVTFKGSEKELTKEFQSYNLIGLE